MNLIDREQEEQEEQELMGSAEAAELLGIKLDRLRYLSRLGRVPSQTLSIQGTRIYKRSELLNLERPY